MAHIHHAFTECPPSDRRRVRDEMAFEVLQNLLRDNTMRVAARELFPRLSSENALAARAYQIVDALIEEGSRAE